MTSRVLLVLAANAALVPAGAGLLLLIDAWHRLGRWSRFAVALLAGQALFLTFAPLLLYARLSVSPVVVLPLSVALLAAGVVWTRRRGRALDGRSEGAVHGDAWFAAAILIAPLVVLAVAAVAQPLYEIDSMLNWVMKAKVIWANGDHLTGVLDPQVFARPDLHPQSHLEYPLGMNALLAWSFHWMGAADVRVMHLQLVLLLAAAVGTSWTILRPLVPDLPLALGLAGLVAMPAAAHHLLTAYADVPLAIVWATGALVLFRWAAEGLRYQLALATLLLAAALAIKQDGAFYDIAIYVGVAVAVLARAPREWRRLLELAGSAGVVALTRCAMADLLRCARPGQTRRPSGACSDAGAGRPRSSHARRDGERRHASANHPPGRASRSGACARLRMAAATDRDGRTVSRLDSGGRGRDRLHLLEQRRDPRARPDPGAGAHHDGSDHPVLVGGAASRVRGDRVSAHLRGDDSHAAPLFFQKVSQFPS